MAAAGLSRAIPRVEPREDQQRRGVATGGTCAIPTRTQRTDSGLKPRITIYVIGPHTPDVDFAFSALGVSMKFLFGTREIRRKETRSITAGGARLLPTD